MSRAKCLGAETSLFQNCSKPKCMGPIHFGALTSCCRNIYGPKCFGAVLLPYSFNHYCTIIQKDHGRGAKQDVKLCNTVLVFTHPQNQCIKKQSVSHKEILDFFFSSTLLKSFAETEKNSSKLVLPEFFTILFISLALFLVLVTQTSRGTSDENGFNGGAMVT